MGMEGIGEWWGLVVWWLGWAFQLSLVFFFQISIVEVVWWYIMSQSLAILQPRDVLQGYFCRNLQVRELCQLCDVTTKTN